MLHRFLNIFILAIAVISCDAPNTSKALSAEDIISKSYQFTGCDSLVEGRQSFTFRKKDFTITRTGGVYQYQRLSRDSSGNYLLDRLNNSGFKRWINDTLIPLDSASQNKLANQVNSVVYFAFLPLLLKDPAVRLKKLGSSEINGTNYHKIQVSFSEEDGGEDFEDVFLYFFDSQDFSLDYLAYQYYTGKGGIRFRKAINPRRINGVLVQDYENYKPRNLESTHFYEIEKYFLNNDLELLSLIQLENVSIN
ncbi:DUF6503 family protein [Luteibaculum oceani]|uniref:Deoxyribose-phosphate aldolase n=1 Tax=Luteibaculum oceani TaxID=1294296 RepID=A0A5C6VJQ7_9FLAO|nr:DUF6503 family protein [Luteibaculum oceani]TXC85200.1 hypothetical protein FRX97_00840 [Luteibaculum oceani]